MARTDLMLLLFQKESGERIGGSVLHHIRWQIPLFEIGCRLRTEYTGQRSAEDDQGVPGLPKRCKAATSRIRPGPAAVRRAAGTVAVA